MENGSGIFRPVFILWFSQSVIESDNGTSYPVAKNARYGHSAVHLLCI